MSFWTSYQQAVGKFDNTSYLHTKSLKSYMKSYMKSSQELLAGYVLVYGKQLLILAKKTTLKGGKGELIHGLPRSPATYSGKFPD